LKASWKLIALAPEEDALSVVASISETLLALIPTSPVVETTLPVA
jgi:hypothetical protein